MNIVVTSKEINLSTHFIPEDFLKEKRDVVGREGFTKSGIFHRMVCVLRRKFVLVDKIKQNL